VPDEGLTLREGAIAAWPGAWQGKNLLRITHALGIDVDAPWRELAQRDRDWLLYTDEQPRVAIHRRGEPDDTTGRDYHGTFSSARRHVRHTLARSGSERMRATVLPFVRSTTCRDCHGSGLTAAARAVTFLGRSITELGALSFRDLAALLAPVGDQATEREPAAGEVAARLCADVVARLTVLVELGLGYLSLGRGSTTLSPGEAQRLRLATQLRSGLFGVVYVLDEPSAGLHPADAEPLLRVLDDLRAAGNTLFVVEHDLDVVRRADWVVDLGPGAGEHGGRVLHSGPVADLEAVTGSPTSDHLFGRVPRFEHEPREPDGWVRLQGVTRHNLVDLDVDLPVGVLTAVTGVSGSGKSTLVTGVLAELVRERLGAPAEVLDGDEDDGGDPQDAGGPAVRRAEGLAAFDRLVRVDQRPIGRTPRSNLATYTGLFDAVRRVFAGTEEARSRGYGAGRFSFNTPEGRCETCQGEGFVEVELVFLPGTYSPCPTCHGARYDADTLEVTYRGRSVAAVLAMSVDEAAGFLDDVPAAARSLASLRDVGLGYLRLGQPATELSGGEAQRIKLATELQRTRRGHTLYVLDEPTSGLHPADTALLVRQLHRLVDGGDTVVVVEHDLDVVATADWVVDLGPGGGDVGGRVVAAGRPEDVARAEGSATAAYLARRLSR